MGLYAKDTGDGQTYDPVEAGIHHGICYAVYDLGTQYSERFNNKARKCLIVWELPEERIDIEKDGEMRNLPRAISKQYTVSLHEKSNLRKDLENWRGRAFTGKELEGFNLEKLLGVNCMVQVIHRTKDDKTYANVSSIIPLMKNYEKREPENPVKFFSFEDHTSIPEGTPDWVSEIIHRAEEWGGGSESPDDFPYDNTPPPDDDDIPF